jgi:putative transposase
MVTPAAKREAVAHLQALLDVSEWRACRVVVADRTVTCDLDHDLGRFAHDPRQLGPRRLSGIKTKVTNPLQTSHPNWVYCLL